MQGINTEISDKLKRTLGPKETATYRVLGLKIKPNGKGVDMPTSVYVPPIDTVMDPGNNNELVEIKCLLSSTPARTTDGSQKVIEKYMDLSFERSGNGLIILKGGNNKHARMYQFMEITNRNKSNTNRDVSVRPLFERIDKKKENKEKLEKAAAVIGAQNIALTADEGVIRTIAGGFKLNPTLSVEELRLQLKGLAEKEPERFIQNTAPNPLDTIRVHLENGVDGGHLSFDEASNTWKFAKWDAPKGLKKQIIPVPVGEDSVDAILKHFASKDGQADLDRLLGYLKED